MTVKINTDGVVAIVLDIGKETIGKGMPLTIIPLVFRDNMTSTYSFQSQVFIHTSDEGLAETRSFLFWYKEIGHFACYVSIAWTVLGPHLLASDTTACESQFCATMGASADLQRYILVSFSWICVDDDKDEYELRLGLKRVEDQKPMATVVIISPTPAQLDDWLLYQEILADDYNSRTEARAVYLARKKLEEEELKEKAREEAKSALGRHFEDNKI